MTGIERLHEIMTRLRDPERGCPWDREQTLESLKPCVLEETHELLAAMDRPDDKAGRFTFDDVANAISDKLVHRHPHVFGSVDAKDSATVLRNWEQIKQMEHRKESRHSALDGVPAALPGLLKAQRTQEKAARVGFDWKDAKGPMDKIEEELGELKAEIASRKSAKPADSVRVKEELGDLVFAVCNLARHLGVDAESAVELTTSRFSRRFRAVEQGAKESGRALRDMTLGEMDALWEEAKRKEG